MKFVTRIIIRTSLVLSLIIGIWTVGFYLVIMEEIRDELDDSLDDYSETIIIRALAGEKLPSNDNGTNNQFYLQSVSKQYAIENKHISYRDSMVYISEKKETEPARILKTIFKDDNDQYFELVVSTPSIETEDMVGTLGNLVLGLYLFLILFLTIIEVFMIKRNMKPLYTLLDWLNNYRINETTKPLQDNTSISEFKRLNKAVSEMAMRNEQLFDQQKQFIGNASHEIQTPVAICSNRLENLLDDESLNEAQAAEIAKTIQTLRHLSKLNRSLLLLAKIDNSQFSDIKEINLNNLARHHLSDFIEIYSYMKISLHIEEHGEFIHSINEDLATTLVTNILKNSFVHNKSNGRIEIIFSQDQFKISNSGETDSALDDQKLFQRFYQGKKKAGSTGLGLAIAHAICSQHNLSISYTFEHHAHRFIIRK